MKRWAILTCGIYAIALVLLTLPVILLTSGTWGEDEGASLTDALELFSWPYYWVWVGVMTLGQAALLLVPVRIADRHLKPRRPLIVPMLATAFFLALLFYAGMSSLLCAIFSDDAIEWLFLSMVEAGSGAEANPALGSAAPTSGLGLSQETRALLGTINVTLILWMIWALVFHRYVRQDSDASLATRCVRWLLRGSILELLIAVPSHIVVRRREDCCAPAVTFWGISTGISVMLLCFGPGLFYLFARRLGKRRPQSEGAADPLTPPSSPGNLSQ